MTSTKFARIWTMIERFRLRRGTAYTRGNIPSVRVTNILSNVKQTHPPPDSSQPVVYQIRLKGHLGSQWTDWFGGLTITLEDDSDTLLTGPVIDQAALHGLLKKVRDLGLPLITFPAHFNPR